MLSSVSVVEDEQEKEEPGDDFDSWDNFGGQGKDDKGGEVMRYPALMLEILK